MSSDGYEAQCPVGAALSIIGAKWKIMILFHLLQGTKRFSELQKLLPGITQKMLSMRLRELEEDRILKRKVYAVVPPKVEYTLTEFGCSLEPVIKKVKSFGEQVIEQNKGSRKKKK